MSKQKYKILIIDDSAEDRVTFRYYLEKNSECIYEFLEAELGDEGVTACLESKPDCVLLDYNLPDRDGLAVLKAINPDPLDPVFPVILLTGAGDESLAVKAMKQGAQDYLVKGEFSYRELHSAVHSAMEIINLRRKHKISENELRESQEHLSAIFRQTAVGICQTDMKGRYVLVNDKFCELVGRTGEELLTLRFQDITHPEDLQPNLEMIGKMREGLQSFVIEKRYIRPDDSIVWVRSSVSFIYDTNGEPVFGVAAVQDITESKMAEIDLCRSEAELKDFIENASVGLHWVDGDGIIIWANRAEMELLGYSPEEYIGHSISEFHADEEVISDILRRLKSDDTLHNYEARLRCKDGSLRHVLINSNVLWQDGKFVHTRCFTRDISERKQTEEALNRYRLLSERSRDIMLFFRPDGQFVEVNQAAVNAYGYTREELLAKSFYDIRAEVTWNDIPAQIRRVEKGAFQFETVHRRKDGTEFPAEASWSFTELDGERVILSIVRDVSERKQAEKLLRESEEHLRLATEAAEMYSWEIDLSDRTIKFADNQAQVLGFALPENYSATMAFVHPADYADADRAFDAEIKNTETFETEYRLIHPNTGAAVWVCTTGVVITDVRGLPVRLVGVTQNITSRKEADRKSVV